MYWVEYYCPRQSPYWQRRINPIQSIQTAIAEAMMVKPPNGLARVINQFGQVVYNA